jgi:putative MFS transporter
VAELIETTPTKPSIRQTAESSWTMGRVERIRATAVGVATAISRVGAAVGTFSLPYSIQTYGIGTTMVMSTGLTFLGFILCFLLAPETKGLTLRECSQLELADR